MIGSNTNIEDQITEALAPFDQQNRVEPYRVHLEHPEIASMSEQFGIPAAHLNELSRKMPEWSNQPGGVDAFGLYRMSASNPDGRWDWYAIGGRWDGHIPGSRHNCIKAATLAKSTILEQRLPYFLLTPEREWLEREHFYLSRGPKPSIVRESMEDGSWLRSVQETLLRWPDHYVVCVDIHG